MLYLYGDMVDDSYKLSNYDFICILLIFSKFTKVFHLRSTTLTTQFPIKYVFFRFINTVKHEVGHISPIIDISVPLESFKKWKLLNYLRSLFRSLFLSSVYEMIESYVKKLLTLLCYESLVGKRKKKILRV